MTSDGSAGRSIFFIAPSTRLLERDLPLLQNAIRLLGEGLEMHRIAVSPHIFTRDETIGHVTAPIADRAREFKAAIRKHDIIVSVAGGTGAEDLVPTLDRSDYRAIGKRKPLLIGFSDFSFLLNEVYSRCRAPGILFPALRLTEENVGMVLSLIRKAGTTCLGTAWLADPPAGEISGVAIGGNLTTFVNFLNRENPPRLVWRDHVLFIEDVGIDLEDLHRLLAALRRHRVFRTIRGLVIGALTEQLNTPAGDEYQERAVSFLLAYLDGVLKRRRETGSPLPIMAMRSFGHHLSRELPAIPIGGRVGLAASRMASFRLF